MTILLDANVLIALVVEDHVHHDAAESWFARSTEPIATCPITQGSLVRLLIREGQPAQAAVAVVSALMAPSVSPHTIPFRSIRSATYTFRYRSLARATARPRSR